MNPIIVDAALKARLDHVDGPLELRDESGRTPGYFHPVANMDGSGVRSIQSPITREELERRRSEKGGRSLKEILDDLSRS